VQVTPPIHQLPRTKRFFIDSQLSGTYPQTGFWKTDHFLEADFWPGGVFEMLMTVTQRHQSQENLLTFAALVHIFGSIRRGEG
jgi:hypothetical protein